jgi:thiosulfate/3-mercaptopyruvate sulfurtransferase
MVGLPLSLDAPSITRGTFNGAPDASLLLSAEQLQKRLTQPELTLLDARALPRFKGEVEPIDPVAGHIPGAQCAAFTDNLGADGRFLPADQLKQRFAAKLANRSPNDLVAYCGSGVTACHNLFALCLAGYPLGTLYAGSWSEWINDPARGVEKGE